MTSLKNLIYQRDLNGVKEYLSNGGNVNAVIKLNFSNTTPLLYAIDCDCDDEFASLQQTINCDYFVLHHSDDDVNKYSFRDDEITLHLIRAGADVLATNHEGMTPLIFSLSTQRGYKIVEELINAGSDINAKCNRSITPLMYALKGDYNKALVENFLRMGANVHARDIHLFTPLFYAVKHINRFEVVSLLIKYGADASVRNKFMDNVLSGFPCNGNCSKENCENKPLIYLLLSNGLKLEKEDGLSVIITTCCNYLINLYVKKGMSIDSRRSTDGSTVLVNAVFRRLPLKVNCLLVLFNADVNCVDNQLQYAFHYDSKMSNDKYEVHTLLLYHGINLFARNKNNKTALDFVLESYNRHVLGPYDNFDDDDYYNLTYKTYTMIRLRSAKPADPIIKHVLLFIDVNRLDHSFNKLYSDRIEECKIELREMKNTFIKGNLTFYEFCLLKKYYKSEFVDISVDEYFYDFEQIRNLFPLYHDMIIMRMKDNQLDRFKRGLNNRLENLIIKPSTVVENEINSDVRIIFDCTCLIAKHLDKKAIYNLFLASF